MSLQNFSYFFFLFVTTIVYLQLSQKWQTPFLAVASFWFYAQNLATTYTSALSNGAEPLQAMLHVCISLGLVLGTSVFVWRMGLALATAQGAQKTAFLRIGVLTLLTVLALFKYYNLSPLPTLLDGSVLAQLPFPLGISFFTFAAIAYLVDVARGDCTAERRFLHVSTFLFFFATVTSGPICRGAKILPQLEEEHRFDATRTVNALRLFALGLFKKVAIADVLSLVVNEVFGALSNYHAPMLLLALLFYTFQLYFDFAGYSDLARASGAFLGLDLPENFKTPFFATNFSGFWTRWHISLSSWLQDYLFMPLAWADLANAPVFIKKLLKGAEHFPVEFCVFATFFLSGFWHGNTAPFIIWGVLQGLYRVGEELLHRKFGRPKRKGVSAWKLWGKRGVVFFVWSFSMIFFRIGSSKGTNAELLAQCGSFFAQFAKNWHITAFFSEYNNAIAAGFYQHSLLQLAYMLFVVFTLAIGIYLDAQRFFYFKDKPTELVLCAQKPVVKWVLYYALVLCIFAGLIIQNGGFAGGSFAYAQY